MTNQMTRTQLGAHSTLFTHRFCLIKHRPLTAHSTLYQQMIARENQQSTGGFRDRFIQRCQQTPHHRPAVDKGRIGNGCTTGQRQCFAQRGSQRQRKRYRFGHRAIDGQGPLSYRRLCFHRCGNVKQRLHIVDHHANRQRQRRRWNTPSGRQPNGDHFISRRVNIRQDMQTNSGRQQRRLTISSHAFAKSFRLINWTPSSITSASR